MESLNDLGLKYKTDKSTITHCYLDVYEKYFAPLKNEELIVLEIGVAGGASIKMWREYFPNAKVYGIDNNTDCAGEGIFIGSQTDTVFLDKVIAEIGVPDIIISDGSHVGDEEIITWKHLFPKMKSNTIYVLEDTATFYNNHYSGNFQSNGRTNAFNFFSNLVYDIDVAGRGMCGNQDFCINHPSTEPPVPEFSRVLKSIHFYTSLWFFIRK